MQTSVSEKKKTQQKQMQGDVFLSGTVRVSKKDMEQSLAEGRLVDYWGKDDNFECIQVNHIRDISDEVGQLRAVRRL